MKTSLTPAQYVTQRAWEHARLECCPLHPRGGCSLSRHGSYPRRWPEPLRVARYYCPEGHTTFSLLPDFLASRLPGTLDEIEVAVVTAEVSPTLAVAADRVRPPESWESCDDGASDEDEVRDPITLEATTRWLRRRMKMVTVTLVAVAGLLPELFAGCELTLSGLRQQKGTSSVLVLLREIAAEHLAVLPPPVGFGPRPRPRKNRRSAAQQSLCPDRPP